MLEKICIVGTHHDYQIDIRHPQLFQNLDDYIGIHSLGKPLVAEEATSPTLVTEWAVFAGLEWLPVELDGKYRKQLDMELGGQFTHPVPLTNFREWIWFIRTMRRAHELQMKTALLVCGYCHVTGIARKFMDAGVDTVFETFAPVQPMSFHWEARVEIRCQRCKEWVRSDKTQWVYPDFVRNFVSKRVCETCAAILEPKVPEGQDAD